MIIPISIVAVVALICNCIYTYDLKKCNKRLKKDLSDYERLSSAENIKLSRIVLNGAVCVIRVDKISKKFYKIKSFPFDECDYEDFKFAIREAEELIETIESA